jgi:hypothetical protein
MIRDIEKFKIEWSNRQDITQMDIMKVKESISTNTTRINNHMNALKQHDVIIETFRNSIQEIYDTLQDLNTKKMDNVGYEKELF